jgi:heme-degrading monooxygenase HmoA
MMRGLFFDVQPKPGHMDHYFDHVARLKPILARHTGLSFLDRYRPLDDAGALLSHQLWADDAAIKAWRADPEHRRSQSAGIKVHFDDYRIRVGKLIDAHTTHTLPSDTRLLIAAYGPGPIDLAAGRAYESVNHQGQFLTLATAHDPATATALLAAADTQGADTLRLFAIDRDYTLTDRHEAPN